MTKLIAQLSEALSTHAANTATFYDIIAKAKEHNMDIASKRQVRKWLRGMSAPGVQTRVLIYKKLLTQAVCRWKLEKEGKK